MIQLQDVTKSFGEKTLLEHVTWQVGDRDRVGLCGPNGAGKTTLLKMLAGFDEPDAGVIQKPNALTFGYLPQDGLSHSGRTITAEASLALKPLLDLKAEMHDLEARLGDPAMNEQEHDALLHRYSDVQDQFRLGDGYQIELKVATVLRGLGFEAEMHDQLTDHLSGGWQMRLALAKLLLSAPDLLLLDEPTNHLDLEARNWLEEYLVGYPRSVILVSHDRYFLDAVVTHIADLSLLSEMKRVSQEIATSEPKIDVLIPNAGAMFNRRTVTADGLEKTFALNHMGYFIPTLALLPNMVEGGRIVVTASNAHRGAVLDFGDLQSAHGYSGFSVYSRSKLMNILFTRALARRLEGGSGARGITANALNPGFVATRFGDESGGLMQPLLKVVKPLGAIKPEEGAQTIIWLASSPEVVSVNGGYFYECKPRTPTVHALNDTDGEKLWAVSEEIVARV